MASAPVAKPPRVKMRKHRKWLRDQAPRPIRDRRHRLHALAAAAHQQAKAIIPQRLATIGVTNNPRQTLDIGRERRFTVVGPTVHQARFRRFTKRPHYQLSGGSESPDGATF